jgi:hypothetical protein
MNASPSTLFGFGQAQPQQLLNSRSLFLTPTTTVDVLIGVNLGDRPMVVPISPPAPVCLARSRRPGQDGDPTGPCR